MGAPGFDVPVVNKTESSAIDLGNHFRERIGRIELAISTSPMSGELESSVAHRFAMKVLRIRGPDEDHQQTKVEKTANTPD